jgi:hypothetical protein
LPQGLQRIRYYGLMGNRHREEKLAKCRRLLDMTPKMPADTDVKAISDYRDRYQALTGVSLPFLSARSRRRYLSAAKQSQHLPTMPYRTDLIFAADHDVGINPHSVEVGRRFITIHF